MHYLKSFADECSSLLSPSLVQGNTVVLACKFLNRKWELLFVFEREGKKNCLDSKHKIGIARIQFGANLKSLFVGLLKNAWERRRFTIWIDMAATV